MNDNHHSSESNPEPSRPQPGGWVPFLGGRWALLLCVLVLGLLAIYPAWRWWREPEDPPATPGAPAADRQRMEAFLAATDYGAFLQVMERQPRKARSELPPEWLRRYDEIKPALLFTVREVGTEEVSQLMPFPGECAKAGEKKGTRSRPLCFSDLFVLTFLFSFSPPS